MKHRHLTHHRYTLAAIDDILENGTLADWRPLLARVRREPEGEVARRVEQILDARDLEDVDAFWRAYLADARARRKRPPVRAAGR